MKVLNLYACLGGNRYKWDQISPDLEVTAVEIDPEAAKLYKQRFINDTVLIEDAHEYLKNNYFKYDFIWSSPPCPSHSRARFWGCKNNTALYKPIYPDLTLYQEIIFLQNYFKGKFCIENVTPYYEPLIPAQSRGRHLYWCNFKLPTILSNREDPTKIRKGSELTDLCKFHDFDFKLYKGDQRVLKMARNLVDYEAGKTILETALNIVTKNNTNQLELTY